MSRTHRTFPDEFRLSEGESIKGRDKKPWYKPGKIFKYCKKRARKARERNALRSGDVIPVFRKSDIWEYV